MVFIELTCRKLSKLLESGARKAIALKIREPLIPQTVYMIFVAAAFEFLGSGPSCVCLQPWTLQALGEWRVRRYCTQVS